MKHHFWEHVFMAASEPSKFFSNLQQEENGKLCPSKRHVWFFNIWLYDHIPTLETVYEKWKSCLYQVSKGKSNVKHMKYVLNDKELIQVFIFLFL